MQFIDPSVTGPIECGAKRCGVPSSPLYTKRDIASSRSRTNISDRKGIYYACQHSALPFGIPRRLIGEYTARTGVRSSICNDSGTGGMMEPHHFTRTSSQPCYIWAHICSSRRWEYYRRTPTLLCGCCRKFPTKKDVHCLVNPRAFGKYDRLPDSNRISGASYIGLRTGA